MLFLEEAAPLNIPTPAAGSAPVSYALGGPVPMVAVPVQYPDGRVMYHVYPVAQPTAQVLPPPPSESTFAPHPSTPRLSAAVLPMAHSVADS